MEANIIPQSGWEITRFLSPKIVKRKAKIMAIPPSLERLGEWIWREESLFLNFVLILRKILLEAQIKKYARITEIIKDLINGKRYKFIRCIQYPLLPSGEDVPPRDR
jgi:hypothetical protein